MSQLENALKSLTIEEGDSPETIADKMEQLLNDKLFKNIPHKKKRKK
jgi:hypothetical protein